MIHAPPSGHIRGLVKDAYALSEDVDVPGHRNQIFKVISVLSDNVARIRHELANEEIWPRDKFINGLAKFNLFSSHKQPSVETMAAPTPEREAKPPPSPPKAVELFGGRLEIPKGAKGNEAHFFWQNVPMDSGMHKLEERKMRLLHQKAYYYNSQYCL